MCNTWKNETTIPNAIICLLISLGISVFWPDPLPPPPAPDLWSEAPESKERDMKLCSNCGKAVDQKWSMCPYCSKKVWANGFLQ